MEQKAQRKSMIKVRGGYSDKNGYNVVCNSLQVDDFDDRTRVVICNKLYELCEYIFETHNKKFNYSEWGKSNRFCKDLLTEVFNVSTALEYDSKYDWRLVFKRVEGVTLNALKNEVLDIVWFIINWFNDNTRDLQVDLQQYFNFYLEKECVGYRLLTWKLLILRMMKKSRPSIRHVIANIIVVRYILKKHWVSYLIEKVQIIRIVLKKV